VKTLGFSGAGNNEWTQYQLALTDFVEPGSDIFIAFREHVANTSVEGDALFLDLVEVTSMVTAINERLEGISHFQLHQNHPNPFNPSTQITFSLLQDAEVTLRVFDLLGNAVATIIEKRHYSRGLHQVHFDAKSLSNGIYFYKIETAKFVEVKKMLLVR
jgi:hypothetical protein